MTTSSTSNPTPNVSRSLDRSSLPLEEEYLQTPLDLLARIGSVAVDETHSFLSCIRANHAHAGDVHGVKMCDENFGRLKWASTNLEKPLEVEANQHTVFHQLEEQLLQGRGFLKSPNFVDWLDDIQVVVVSNNYSELVPEPLESHEVQMPYPRMAFEMRLNGACTIVLCQQTTPDVVDTFHYMKTADLWIPMNRDGFSSRVHNFAVRNALGVVICLEAEVATPRLVRAPATLNRARLKRSKPALRDHLVVDLRQRYLSEGDQTASVAGGCRRSPRLHFRRGHWVNYPHCRSWRKWTLVGDAFDGVVSKNYLS